MLFACRFKILRVSKFSKLPSCRLSPSRFRERSSESSAFIEGHTSVLGISSNRFSEKSSSLREFGSWKIFVRRLFFTVKLLKFFSTHYYTQNIFLNFVNKERRTCSWLIEWDYCAQRRSIDCSSYRVPEAWAAARMSMVLFFPKNCAIDSKIADWRVSEI